LLSRDDFDMAHRCVFRLRPIVLMIGPAQDANRVAAVFRLPLSQAGLRKFRIGEDDPRNLLLMHASWNAEEYIADDEASVVRSGVSERRLARHIANREDAAIGSPQPLVDDDAALPVFDPPSFQAEPVEVGPSPRCDENMACRDRLFAVWTSNDDLQPGPPRAGLITVTLQLIQLWPIWQ